MEKYNEVFWGEVAPCDHLLQIYESDDLFLRALEGFVVTGFLYGDAVIIIATSSHLEALEKRLKEDFSIGKLKSSGQYIPVDAEEALPEFIIDDKVDENLFKIFVNNLFTKAQKDGRKVRVFGELVALLWGQGNRSATIKLEQLWDELCNSGVMCLFCAYPKSGFRQDIHDSIKEICLHHSKMIEKNIVSPEINTYGEKLSIQTLR